MKLALFVVCVAATSARAGVTGMFGVGEQVSGGGGYAGSQHGLAIDAALAYEVADGIALGVRGSIATPSSYPGELDEGNLAGDYEQTMYSVVPIDLGITAIFTRHSWWLAPWLGEHISSTTATSNLGYNASITTADFAMIGVTGGIDLGDQLALFVDLEHSVGGPRLDEFPSDANPQFQSWIAMTLGLAYHR